MNNVMRHFINIAEGKNTVDPKFARRLLTKISPTLSQAEDKLDEEFTSAFAGTVAFISVFIGGVEVANVGPLDVRGAYKMQQGIEDDLERSYKKSHPHGFTDGSGTIYRLKDWEVNVETCHSSECSDIIKPRMQAIKARSS